MRLCPDPTPRTFVPTACGSPSRAPPFMEIVLILTPGRRARTLDCLGEDTRFRTHETGPGQTAPDPPGRSRGTGPNQGEIPRSPGPQSTNGRQGGYPVDLDRCQGFGIPFDRQRAIPFTALRRKSPVTPGPFPVETAGVNLAGPGPGADKRSTAPPRAANATSCRSAEANDSRSHLPFDSMSMEQEWRSFSWRNGDSSSIFDRFPSVFTEPASRCMNLS